MAQEKIRLPTSEAGLVRYFEEAKSKFQLSPVTVVSFVIGMIIILLIFNKIF
ncbi:MAG: preprotein translocase subunit Sec61beta [Candidatus Nanoarchaeia archaeon]